MRIKLIICWWIVLLQSAINAELNVTRFKKRTRGRCKDPLGMESGAIPNDALSASSAHTSLEAKYARLRTDDETGGGAWCPSGLVTPDTYAYLQIELGHLTVLTRIETQGRHARGEGREYTEVYVLEFQRSDEDRTWRRFYQRNGKEEFTANSNTHTSVFQELYPPLIALRIRIVPFVRVPKPVCLRVELYGCSWTDSLLSYDIPQGHTYQATEGRQRPVSLDDTTYDGRHDTDQQLLRAGLGQLTDFENGNIKWRRNHTPWIGWDKSKLNKYGLRLQMLFKFESIRNISLVSFYSLARSAEKIGVFETATFEFSFDGVSFSSESETFRYAGTTDEVALAVAVPLRPRMCRYLRVTLTHQRDMNWILISEVYLHSLPAPHDYKVPPIPPPEPSQKTTKSNGRENTSYDSVIVYQDQSKADKSQNSAACKVQNNINITRIFCLLNLIIFLQKLSER